MHTNIAQIDWLTVTSYDSYVAYHVAEQIEKYAGKRSNNVKRMQYTGNLWHLAGGSVYSGIGWQKGERHHLIQATGAAAEPVFAFLQETEDGKEAGFTITRMDVQITVDWDRRQGWLMRRLDHWRNRERASSTSIESPHNGGAGTLMTIYLGSRSSDRVIRVYEKAALGEDIYLRFEVEYKGERARNAYRALSKGVATRGGMLRYEISSRCDEAMSALFMPYLDEESPFKVSYVKSKDNSDDFCLNVAIPSIRKHITAHDNNGRVEMAVRELYTWLVYHYGDKEKEPGQGVDNDGTIT